MAGKIVLICWYILITYYCSTQQTIQKFATSLKYQNLRIVTDNNPFLPKNFDKASTSLVWARMSCAQFCADSANCSAFNFYDNGQFYVCELVPDNLCNNGTDKVFVKKAGSLIWDKLSSQMRETCINTLSNSRTGIACATMRPGCYGMWPNCSNCTRTCIDCNNRQMKSCVMWPDGDGPDSVPIFGRCYQSNTILMDRFVDQFTGIVWHNYRMSFYDINRLYKLNAYRILQFYFENKYGHRLAKYGNSYISVNGTLMNMTFKAPTYSSEQDVFNLGGQTLSAVPFVEVTDDRYGCGSFWLLNPSNATYCPGGKLGMFGRPRYSGYNLFSTGITCPVCNWGGYLRYGKIELTPS